MKKRAVTSYTQDADYVARLQAKLTFHKVDAEIRVSRFGKQVEVYGAPKDASKISALAIMAHSK